MTKQMYLLSLVVLTFSYVPVLSFTPPNPCPEVFRYSHSPYGAVEGLITLPIDAGNYLHLTVNASMRGFFGKERSNMKIEMLTPSRDIVFGSARWIKYRVLFPVQESIPRVSLITLNEHLFCRGPPEPVVVPGPPVTAMHSTHTFQMSAARSSGLLNGLLGTNPVIKESNDFYVSKKEVK